MNWYIFNSIGVIGTKEPYIITKAYNTIPSEQETLTAIILSLQGTKDEVVSFTLSYSLSVRIDDFLEIYHETNHILTGDLENIFIPVPIANIANAHHYRLKFECTGDDVTLYNIERRFRVKGMSR